MGLLVVSSWMKCEKRVHHLIVNDRQKPPHHYPFTMVQMKDAPMTHPSITGLSSWS